MFTLLTVEVVVLSDGAEKVAPLIPGRFNNPLMVRFIVSGAFPSEFLRFSHPLARSFI